MSEVALLNPGSDAELARKLLELARRHLHNYEQTLLTRELTREDYLKTFGAKTALELTLEAMEVDYRRATLK